MGIMVAAADGAGTAAGYWVNVPSPVFGLFNTFDTSTNCATGVVAADPAG